MGKTANRFPPKCVRVQCRWSLTMRDSMDRTVRRSCRFSAKIDCAPRTLNERVFEENWRVYGVRKVWRQLDREGFDVARCTMVRLMKGMGLPGIIRGKPHRTTVPDKSAPCPRDKVNRQFRVLITQETLTSRPLAEDHRLQCHCPERLSERLPD